MNNRKTLKAAVLAQALLAACFFAVAGAQEGGEGDLAMAISQFDTTNGAAAMWWTEDFWAGMAYLDKSSDAMLGYHMMRIAGAEHLFFSLLSLNEGSGPVEIEGPAMLANSNGTKVYEVKVHESFSEMMPGLIAFPRADSQGKALVTDKTDSLTLDVKYRGGTAGEFEWSLPLFYPDAVDEGRAWLAKPVEKKESEMTEDEILNKYLPPVLRIDLESGIIAVYFTEQMSALVFAMNPALKNDPLLRAEVKKILHDHSIFFIGTMKNRREERLVKMAAGARAVGVGGKKFDMDVKARDEFVASMEKKKDESKEAPFEFMLFPQLGSKGRVELLLKDPETEREISFKWER